MTQRAQESLRITVLGKQSLQEARAWEDDWTGKTSAKERRKAQNRLHQRAWRRRKAMDRTEEACHNSEMALYSPVHDFLTPAFVAAAASLIPGGYDKSGPQIQAEHDVQVLEAPATEIVSVVSSQCGQPASLPSNIHSHMRHNLVTTYSSISASKRKPTTLVAPVLPYIDPSASTEYIRPPYGFTFPLAPDHHLITLIQYNVLRAMITNFHICNIMHTMPTECRVALTLSLLHHPPSTAPPTFTPTPTQGLVPHSDWIDSVPCPTLRDNLILASTSGGGGGFDEADLCADTCGGLFEGLDDCATKGLLVWGDPWVVGNWEVSAGFAKKWGFLLNGCREMLEATNRWRDSRGEEPLVVEVD